MASLLLRIAYKIYRPVGIIKENRKKRLIARVLNNGERYDPQIHPDADKNHVPRYMFALKNIDEDQTILDIACGTGYGSEMMTKKAKYITGVDASPAAISYCRQKRKGGNLAFIQSDFFAFEGRADVVVCFETIEHIICEKIELVLNKLDEMAVQKIIGSFPYKEAKGANKYHYFSHLDETTLNFFTNHTKQIFFQTTEGEILNEIPENKKVQNLVFIIQK